VSTSRAKSQQDASRRHPQERRRGDPHHPQPSEGATGDRAEQRGYGQPHRPQQLRPPAGTPESRERSSPERRDEHGASRSRGRSDDERCHVPAPPFGVLRPLARVLLSVAAETHASRCEARRISCPEHERTLRMSEDRERLPVRLPLRLGLASPATPERTGCADAFSHVEAAPTPPVKNPDCIGDCA
jgi:hypothetical protein